MQKANPHRHRKPTGSLRKVARMISSKQHLKIIMLVLILIVIINALAAAVLSGMFGV